jgi:hypothetical protein
MKKTNREWEMIGKQNVTVRNDDLGGMRAVRNLRQTVATQAMLWAVVTILATATRDVAPGAREALDALAAVDLMHAIYLVWIANAVLMMCLGARIFPQLPVWIGLMFCTIGASLIVGPVPALSIVGSLAAVLLALRLRRAAVVGAAVSQRLARIGTGTTA